MRPQHPRPALYDPSFDHDACGVGFLAHLKGQPSHAIVDEGLRALERLAHRGATGAEADTGDGAGVLIQIPHRLFERECALGRIETPEDRRPLAQLPAPGEYAVGLFFGSQDAQASALAKLIFAMIVRQEGLRLLGWRRVPTDNRHIGRTARSVEPTMDHVFVAPGEGIDDAAFARKLFVVRKRFQSTIKSSGIDDRQYFHLPTLSNKTLVYKGMLTPEQLRDYFGDLDDPRTESALCLFHSRFSTNTFPSWELAHPYRIVAHNGEINTLRGNVNWMRAREALLSSTLFGADLEKTLPIVHEGLSDSACLDSVLELLVSGGRSLPHAVMMLLPEAWEHDATMSPELRAFYAYHGCLMEPWDGPACVCFTDGTQIGAVLDRNGLRPGRFWVTSDDIVILASETGVYDVAPEKILEKGRLGPGRMFLLDLAEGRIVPDAEIKQRVATEVPYLQWTTENLLPLASLPPLEPPERLEGEPLERALAAFGYSDEDLRILLAPMATRGEEAVGSMGNDAALAVLSDRPRPLFDYFQQLFAQVTNPPLDAIREKLVTSLGTAIGPEGNLLDPRPESCHLVLLDGPFLDTAEFARLSGGGPLGVTVLDMTFPAEEGEEGLEPALLSLFAKADNAIANGSKVLLLSDRGVSEQRAPIPSLLAVAGLHNHLVRERKRTRVTLIVESGEAREVHHAAMLIGYGASAICPYLALDALPLLRRHGLAPDDVADDELRARYLAAIEKGVVKVMSKMGISTIASYRGAQIFEAVGLAKELVDKYFTLTPSRVGGVGAREIARDVLAHHARAYTPGPPAALEIAGQYQWRRGGERHLFDPETVFKLQHATRSRSFEIFREYTRAIDEGTERLCTIRGLLQLKTDATTPIPIEEVEPVEAIMSRFVTGAMSYGSIGAEAHETLAIAMNRIGGRSNSGEGGEDPRRFVPDPNGDSRRSAVKQVASARFGVTSAYLCDADELQIKIAQGAKPGEGGQLPGNKVYPWIAAVRHATPGVGLISPPPHHDIYSIEDLAQLIYDLRAANARARVSVKLVAEVGVGTVAAGVAKAKSDVVVIAGHDGGTGASALTSLKHAGGPWELGLAEAQQTLVANALRDRVVLQVDGGMRTGRDVLVAMLLGAEEYGFATAPLVVMGCVMMRVCHLDTCPVGIATQNPDLRARFTGRAEHVVSFFRYIAEEVRQGLAALGLRTVDEGVGRVDLLEPRVESAPPSTRLSLVSTVGPGAAKARSLDFSRILDASHLAAPGATERAPLRSKTRSPAPTPTRTLDRKMLDLAEPALFYGDEVRASLAITNQDRAVGTALGSEITRRHGGQGLPEGTVTFSLTGSAGQSLGAFLPRGVTLLCEGDANDYVGKGLSGGVVAVYPPSSAAFEADKNVIAGNVILYGATAGRVFLRGRAGERFAVRNSGASAVVEGVGDHGCEYMTGGTVVVIGPIGRNFGAGMSGGVAYVLGEAGDVAPRMNHALIALRTPSDADMAVVRALLEEHAALTASTVARDLLLGWDASPPTFTKIVPTEYERVLRGGGHSSAQTLEPPASSRGVAAE